MRWPVSWPAVALEEFLSFTELNMDYLQQTEVKRHCEKMLGYSNPSFSSNFKLIWVRLWVGII